MGNPGLKDDQSSNSSDEDETMETSIYGLI